MKFVFFFKLSFCWTCYPNYNYVALKLHCQMTESPAQCESLGRQNILATDHNFSCIQQIQCGWKTKRRLSGHRNWNAHDRMRKRIIEKMVVIASVRLDTEKCFRHSKFSQFFHGKRVECMIQDRWTVMWLNEMKKSKYGVASSPKEPLIERWVIQV